MKITAESQVKLKLEYSRPHPELIFKCTRFGPKKVEHFDVLRHSTVSHKIRNFDDECSIVCLACSGFRCVQMQFTGSCSPYDKKQTFKT